MRTLIFVAFAAAALSSQPARAQFYTDGPMLEAEHRTIQELRDIERQRSEPADQRVYMTRIAVAIGLGMAAAGFAFHWLRRRA